MKTRISVCLLLVVYAIGLQRATAVPPAESDSDPATRARTLREALDSTNADLATSVKRILDETNKLPSEGRWQMLQLLQSRIRDCQLSPANILVIRSLLDNANPAVKEIVLSEVRRIAGYPNPPPGTEELIRPLFEKASGDQATGGW
jgi:hypothetical protein